MLRRLRVENLGFEHEKGPAFCRPFLCCVRMLAGEEVLYLLDGYVAAHVADGFGER